MSLAVEPRVFLRRTRSEIAVEASSAVLRGAGDQQSYGPMLRRSRGVELARRGRGSAALSVIALIASATTAIGLRESVVRLIPAAGVVYELAGLPANPAGLALRDVRARLVRDGDRKILVTEGEIVNIRRRENHVSSLALAVRGANGLRRYAWTVPAPKTRLGPGEAVNFRARLATPPEDGAEVVVRFAPQVL